MATPLLATKLYIPPLRSDLLPRPRLTNALDEAMRQGRNLILVSAPAGFGKTMMVAEWLHNRAMMGGPGMGLKTAWLSLDRNDNDPIHFWRYVIAALQTVEPAIGQTVEPLLTTAQAQPMPHLALGPLIATLINDLAMVEGPLVLVLDDYHHIEADEIHSTLNFFIDHLPRCVFLMVITRIDPPLGLARRRARRQLSEARVAQLRFNREETAAFLAAAGVILPENELEALENRTEGWVVGLQLAAMSLKDNPDPRAFIEAFAGDDRYVVDYLLEEVLHNLPPRVHGFLLQTSILERLNGDLCQAVVGGQEHSPEACQELLERLESSNLFIVPLDNRRSWYRYHHLFADLLRRRLRQSLDSIAILELYRRACSWFVQQGLVSEAINQALAGPDYELAADLLEWNILSYFYRSDTILVARWLNALPDALLRARPLLCAVKAGVVALSPPYPPESAGPAVVWLDEAERQLEATADSHPAEINELARGFITMLRAYFARFRQEPVEVVIEVTLRALAKIPAEQKAAEARRSLVDINNLRFRSALLTNLGFAYLSSGEHGQASQVIEEARRLGLICGDYFNASASANIQANLAFYRGKLVEAAQICTDFLQTLHKVTSQPAPYSGIVGNTLGAVLVEWNELDEAERVLRQNIELAKLSLATDNVTFGSLALSRLKLARGEIQQVFELVDQGKANWGGVQSLSVTSRVLLWRALGEHDPAYRALAIKWAQENSLLEFGTSPLGIEKKLSLALIRIWVAWHNWKAQDASLPTAPDLAFLPAWLEKQRQVVVGQGWRHWEIETLVIEALVRQVLNDPRGALNCLREALAQAEASKYTRLFLDEGAPMLVLLERVAAEGGITSAYARRLLAAAGTPVETSVMPPQTATAGVRVLARPCLQGGETYDVMEPLSNRELEVLQLLAVGASNSEIAQKLVVAPSTAKKHVIHILGKLHVSSRAKAVSRARELGLIE